MAVINPATFYEWLMLANRHRLKIGPLEAFKDSRVHHALGRVDKRSYGFWDHQTCIDFLNPNEPTPIEFKHAQPVKKGEHK